MSDKPIIFTADSVQAILQGRKTQTRRTNRLDLINERPDKWRLWGPEIDGNWAFTDHPLQGEKGATVDVRCPYGVQGDRLWVRESWAHDCPHCTDIRCGNPDHIWYRANEAPIVAESFAGSARWRSPMFMPRWASRISLEVISVKVERVQSISEDDAYAEGIERLHVNHGPAIRRFRWLWDSLNAKRGYPWSSNCWVWVIEFKRM